MNKTLTLLLIVLSFAACGNEDSPTNQPDVNDLPTLESLRLRDGITRISEDSLAFVLFAPKKQSVYLMGDFNDWTMTESYRMHKEGDRFWIKIGNLQAGKEYICQYLIDNSLRIADPYATKISDPLYDMGISPTVYPNLPPYPMERTTEIAMIVSTDPMSYDWKVSDFSLADPTNLVIYELLIRDFTEERSIKAVQERLPYLKALGVDAIELMPFNEFEGNDSWGYNPSFYFAPDKAYGTSDNYKSFIDECHANGIAVIMDMVLNHTYGSSPMVRMYQQADGNPSADNPWYNVTSPNTTYYWGYDFNHESLYTQAFVDSVCAYWIQEYKIDGYRFDFTKGFTNTPGDGQAYDAARIALLKRMTNEIRKRKPNALIICEHLADNREEKELADYGIRLWGNINYATNEATMGWVANSDMSWASYKQRGWERPNLVAYMESHDEERIMYKNEQWGNVYDGYDVKNLDTGLQRAAAATVLFFSLPGPKMMWQFGELGYDYKLGSSVEEGRLEKKPVRWDYYDVAARKALHDIYVQMIHLRKKEPAFATDDYSIDLVGAFKHIVLRGDDGRPKVVVMANFDVIPLTETIDFGTIGTWTEFFSKEEITITDETARPMTLPAGTFRLYIL